MEIVQTIVMVESNDRARHVVDVVQRVVARTRNSLRLDVSAVQNITMRCRTNRLFGTDAVGVFGVEPSESRPDLLICVAISMAIPLSRFLRSKVLLKMQSPLCINLRGHLPVVSQKTIFQHCQNMLLHS